MKEKNLRSKYWCFTLNNPKSEEVESLKCKLGIINGPCSYIIWQYEKGDSGTEHLQGYLEYKTRKRFNSVKRDIGDRAHIERRMDKRGNARAIQYCKKEGGWNQFEFGKPVEYEHRKLEEVARKLASGEESIMDIAERDPHLYVKHHNGLQNLVNLKCAKRNWAMKIIVLFGKTGTGKTRWAYEKYPNSYTGMWPTGGRWWWDGYQGEESVILDEFKHQIKLVDMLTLLDRYPLKIERKGGWDHFRSKTIIITTNIEPQDWYPKCTSQEKEPLWRRLHEFGTLIHVKLEDGPDDIGLVSTYETKKTSIDTLNQLQLEIPTGERINFSVNKNTYD